MMRWLPIPIVFTVAVYFLLYTPIRMEVDGMRGYRKPMDRAFLDEQTDSMIRVAEDPRFGPPPKTQAERIKLRLAAIREARLYCEEYEKKHRRFKRLSGSVLPAIEFAALPAPLLIWFGLWAPGWLRRVRREKS